MSTDSVNQQAKERVVKQSLQDRAKAFLKRPIPKGVNYVPDSISERFIASYAENGKIDLDPELAELLEICVDEGERAAKKHSGEAREYFEESAAILRAILNESRPAR